MMRDTVLPWEPCPPEAVPAEQGANTVDLHIFQVALQVCPQGKLTDLSPTPSSSVLGMVIPIR